MEAPNAQDIVHVLGHNKARQNQRKRSKKRQKNQYQQRSQNRLLIQHLLKNLRRLLKLMRFPFEVPPSGGFPQSRVNAELLTLRKARFSTTSHEPVTHAESIQ